MAGSDFPFSITSKFRVEGDAEHLVTIRAATAADMQKRLMEASQIFPYAALLSWLQEGHTQVAPNGDVVDYPPTPPNPVKATEAQATQKANARAAQARVRKAETGGNGDQDELPVCPEHGRSATSKFGPLPRPLYCPTQLEDGSYCQWRHDPVQVEAPVGAN